MKPFAYARAGSPAEAVAAAGAAGTRLLAGGTDLLREMKQRRVAPERLVDVSRIAVWRRFSCDARRGLAAGAAVRLAEVEQSPAVARLYPALAEAMAGVATPQVRNLATLAGSLLQRPSCWYYRGGFDCRLAGGGGCAAAAGDNRYGGVFGRGPCVAGHPSDAAAALIALGARVVLVGRRRRRRVVPLDTLYAEPTPADPRETRLGPGEAIAGVRIQAPGRGARSVYLRARDRATWAFALVGLAAAVTIERGRVGAARLVAAGVAPVPWRLHAAEAALRGQALDEAAIGRAAEAAVAGAAPVPSSAYKVAILRALVKRALARLSRIPPAAQPQDGP